MRAVKLKSSHLLTPWAALLPLLLLTVAGNLSATTAFADPLLKCGTLRVSGELDWLKESGKPILTLAPGSFSELRMHVAFSDEAQKTLRKIKRRPVKADFEIQVKDGGASPRDVTILKLLSRANPKAPGADSPTTVLHEEPCPKQAPPQLWNV
jgi:hypothetical protein